MDFKNLQYESLSYIICNLQKNFKLYCEKCLKPYKLTNGLYFYLIYINKNRNCSLNDVSTEFEVDKAHTTRTISRLEQDGYIEKIQNPNDGRAFQLRVTDKGEEVLGDIKNIFSKWDNHIKKEFSDTEYKELVKNLHVVKDIKTAVEEE
ncbi:MarR family transcriptional regulator [Clostridioides difficile]|nr:MarR family transcriptional regulator [Clostridioides difficile]